jgi:hypothetical protein
MMESYSNRYMQVVAGVEYYLPSGGLCCYFKVFGHAPLCKLRPICNGPVKSQLPMFTFYSKDSFLSLELIDGD